MQIQGKKFVVTGGGNGIGRELVIHLLNEEAEVIAVDIDEGGLQETRNLSGEKSSFLATHILDITDKSAVESFAGKVEGVDGLINNAGIIQPFVRINDLDYSAIDRVMKVNFWGTLYMVKAFLPSLLTRPEAHIVNVSSMGGFLPVPGQSVYGASKAAVKLFTEGLATELAGTNVCVTVVFPGAVGTNITANSGVDAPLMKNSDSGGKEFKPLSPEIAARQILRGIKKNKVRVFVGNDSKFLNFLYRLSPQFASNFITKQMGKLLGE